MKFKDLEQDAILKIGKLGYSNYRGQESQNNIYWIKIKDMNNANVITSPNLGDYLNHIMFDDREPTSDNDMVRMNGYANWRYSFARQWLNNKQQTFSWQPTHEGDAYYDRYQRGSRSGFMGRWQAHEQSVFVATEIETNNVPGECKGCKSYKTTDQIWLPSIREFTDSYKNDSDIKAEDFIEKDYEYINYAIIKAARLNFDNVGNITSGRYYNIPTRTARTRANIYVYSNEGYRAGAYYAHANNTHSRVVLQGHINPEAEFVQEYDERNRCYVWVPAVNDQKYDSNIRVFRALWNKIKSPK